MNLYQEFLTEMFLIWQLRKIQEELKQHKKYKKYTRILVR